MAVTVDELVRALQDTFGVIEGEVRSGSVTFISTDAAGGGGLPEAEKELSAGRIIVEHLIVINAQKDGTGNATAGNFVHVGGEGEQWFELAPGAAVEMDWVDLSKVRVGYIGTALTGAQIVVVKWIAHGRVKR